MSISKPNALKLFALKVVTAFVVGGFLKLPYFVRNSNLALGAIASFIPVTMRMSKVEAISDDEATGTF